jgi:serine/threonine-protein kinase
MILGEKYRVLSLLGQGGMGSVWRGEHLGLSAPVAIKVMDPALATTAEGSARFHREAQAAAALRSPHVVQILDHGVDAATQAPFIVMELLEGESLASRLDRCGRLDPAEAAKVLTEAGRALVRAHEAGIVHRDLKPDNLFLVKNDDQEITKVLDFGIAKMASTALGTSSSTSTGSLLGTPYYMSPEQMTGSKHVDYRSDIWSLGIIAFECLVGKRPFEADTVGGLAVLICTGEQVMPSTVGSVPAGFDEWFLRATARNPKARFGSVRELTEDLRRICLGPPVSGAAIAPSFPGASAARHPFGRTVSIANAHPESMGPLSRTTEHVSEARVKRRRWPYAVAGALALGGVAVALIVSSTPEPAAEADTREGSAPAASAAVPPVPTAVDLGRELGVPPPPAPSEVPAQPEAPSAERLQPSVPVASARSAKSNQAPARPTRPPVAQKPETSSPAPSATGTNRLRGLYEQRR